MSLFYNYDDYSKFPILDIIFSNISYPNNAVITTEIILDLSISIFIALIISIIMEYKSFKLLFVDNKISQKSILRSIVLANIISYSLLSVWILFRIKYL